MVVSKKSLYAIRALLELVSRQEKKLVNSAEIAKKQGVSSNFIEIILNELKHSGIVDSRRGSNGGYWLTRNPNNISVLDIISCIDGTMSVINETKDDKQADYFGVNSLGKLWSGVLDVIVSELDAKTLQDLFDEENLFINKKGLNYVI